MFLENMIHVPINTFRSKGMFTDMMIRKIRKIRVK